MRELDPLHQDNTRDEQKQHGQRSKGAWRLPRGMKLWMVNPETELPEEAKPTMVRSMDKKLGENQLGEPLTIKQTALKIENNPLFYYCKAINKKNALRHYFKSKFYAAYRHRNQTSGDSQLDRTQ